MLLKKFKILGHSMQPILENGDEVLVSNLVYIFRKPKIGDVIAFNSKYNKILIKRIKRISNGKYFVFGDNKGDSLDSKNLGSILKSQIIGKVVYKVK